MFEYIIKNNSSPISAITIIEKHEQTQINKHDYVILWFKNDPHKTNTYNMSDTFYDAIDKIFSLDLPVDLAESSKIYNAHFSSLHYGCKRHSSYFMCFYLKKDLSLTSFEEFISYIPFAFPKKTTTLMHALSNHLHLAPSPNPDKTLVDIVDYEEIDDNDMTETPTCNYLVESLKLMCFCWKEKNRGLEESANEQLANDNLIMGYRKLKQQ